MELNHGCLFVYLITNTVSGKDTQFPTVQATPKFGIAPTVIASRSAKSAVADGVFRRSNFRQ